VRPAGADDRELLLGYRDGLFHFFLGFEEGLVNHSGLLSIACLSGG